MDDNSSEAAGVASHVPSYKHLMIRVEAVCSTSSATDAMDDNSSEAAGVASQWWKWPMKFRDMQLQLWMFGTLSEKHMLRGPCVMPLIDAKLQSTMLLDAPYFLRCSYGMTVYNMLWFHSGADVRLEAYKVTWPSVKGTSSKTKQLKAMRWGKFFVPPSELAAQRS